MRVVDYFPGDVIDLPGSTRSSQDKGRVLEIGLLRQYAIVQSQLWTVCFLYDNKDEIVAIGPLRKIVAFNEARNRDRWLRLFFGCLLPLSHLDPDGIE